MGIVSMVVDDQSGDSVDVDVHLLRDTDPSSCLNRDNTATSWVVQAGDTVIAVATGGNVDAAMFMRALNAHGDL